MKNLYNLGSKTIRQSIISIRHHAENGMMHNSLCRLVAVLLMSAGAFSYAQAQTSVWDGTNANSLATADFTGSGTESDPYIIDNAYKFATLAYVTIPNNGNATLNKHFKLTVDIDLNNIEWTFGESNNGNFRGNLNGAGHTISNLNIQARSTDGYNGRYGLFSTMWGANSTNQRAIVRNLVLSNCSLTVNGIPSNKDGNFGIVTGHVSWGIIKDVKVIDPVITLKANVSSHWYVGAVAGYTTQHGQNELRNIYVENPVIKSEATGTLAINSNKRFLVGGVLGCLEWAYNNATQINKASNCVVKGANIDLHHYEPPTVTGEGASRKYNMNCNLFHVGGVIGCHQTPHKKPDNLYFDGKIYAPFGTVFPCVGTHQYGNNGDYFAKRQSEEAEGNTDEVERSITSTWYYGDYKIGLSPDFTDAVIENGYIGGSEGALGTKYLNFNSDAHITTDGGVKYLSVDDEVLRRNNRQCATPVRSSTLLWWSEYNGGADMISVSDYDSDHPAHRSWRDGEQRIYPQYNTNSTTYPPFFMYYGQGIDQSVKHLASATATAFVNGVVKNIDNAMAATPVDITLTITDTNERQRGFEPHHFVVEASGAASGSVSSYKWYANGEYMGTGTSVDVEPSALFWPAPHSKGYQVGKGIFVQAFDSSHNLLAQAGTYLSIPKLHFEGEETAETKTDGLHTYLYDVGTKEHPFLITCEKDLRLFSEKMMQSKDVKQEHTYLTGINSGKRTTFYSGVQEKDNTTPRYAQSYYKLTSNIDFSEDGDDSDFWPIGGNGYPYSTNGNDGQMSTNFVFVGNFDGQGYTIKNLREHWFSGNLETNATDQGMYWGLFSCVGANAMYIKTGDSSSSVAAVRNLIIDGALFTHKTSNKSFYFKNQNSNADPENNSKENHPFTYKGVTRNNYSQACIIGPLTAIAGNYSVIENISVTNSKITDEGSSNYEMGRGYFNVGGVIGASRASISFTNALMDSKLRYLSSNTEIDLRHVLFSLKDQPWWQIHFTVGGIVGTLWNNSGTVETVPYPLPAFYSGKINAPKAFAGPIFGFSWFSGNTDTNWNSFIKHFMGKTSATAEGGFDASAMFYHNFRINNGSEDRLITDDYPSVTSDWGDRNIKGVSTHPQSNSQTASTNFSVDHDLYEFQGVNYGNYEPTYGSASVTGYFNDLSTLSESEQKLIEDFQWKWARDASDEPVLTLGAVGSVQISAKDTYDGKEVTDHDLVATITSAADPDGTHSHYTWYEKKAVAGVDVTPDQPLDGDEATSPTYRAGQTIHNRYIYVKGSVDGVDGEVESAVIMVPRNEDIKASIGKTGSAGNWTLSVSLTSTNGTYADAAALADEGFNISYQWYKGQLGAGELIVGATGSSLNVTDDETTLRYCQVSITDGNIHSVYRDANVNKYIFTLSKLPANTMVVYLNPSGVASVNGGEAGNDSNDGLSPATAVKSWHKAYYLLLDGVTWDDNVIVLMSNSTQERTKEGFFCNKNAETAWSTWYAKYHGNTATTLDDNNGRQINCANEYKPDYVGWYNGDMWKNVTITGKYGENDYTSTAQITMCGGSENNMCIYGDTRFEHLTFYGSGNGSSGGNYDILHCFYNSLEMGDGLIMKNFRRASDAFGRIGDNADNCDFQIFGGPFNDARFKSSTVGFDNDLMEKNLPHQGKGFEINIKSGFFSVICSTYRQNNFNGAGIIGTPNMPVKCTMNIDIDQAWNKAHSNCYSVDGTSGNPMTYDVGMLLAGNHEGAMYGDVDINVYSGRVGRLSSGNLGALRDFNSSNRNSNIPLNAFMGRAGILIDPAKSRFESEEHYYNNEDNLYKGNDRITITEVYGGGLGRAHAFSGMVNIPFYGKNRITVNGGKFEVLYREGTSYPSIDKVTAGVFATGAGGVNGMYHVAEDPTNSASQRLPYWTNTDADKTVAANNVVLYGDWNEYNSHRDKDKVYVKCLDGYDSATDSYQYTSVDPEDTETILTINGGQFGTETHPIYGVYGGGSGFVSTDILGNGSTYPNPRAGNMYAKKDAEHPVATLNINGGEFYCTDGIFAGGRGTDYYYKTNRDGDHESDYIALGQVYGDVEMNIMGGVFHCNVYGGGLGFGDVKLAGSGNPGTITTLKDMARIYGTTTVNITGGTFKRNVYGGGAIANVGYGSSDNAMMTQEITYYGSASKNVVNLNISNALIEGKVFGSAQGKDNTEVTVSPDAIGNVYGNVALNIDNSTVGSDIYGGAEKGDVYGSVTTNIINSELGGDIYGGGMGIVSGEPAMVKASADVTGNTSVTLGAGNTYVKLSEDSYVADYITHHYIYGGGNLASVIGKYKNSSDVETTDIAAVASVESGGNTTVNVNNGMGTSQLTVYGAGLGANTACNMTNVNINNFNTEKNGEPIIGLKDVFGGGNEGVVFTNTSVVMRGGQVFGEVFGGGNLAEVGTLAPASYVIAGDAGYSNFGTTVALNNNSATVWGNIYGGGNQAAVGGLAQVNLTLGRFAGEVFGGGKGTINVDGSGKQTVGARADINGQTKVFINGAKTIWNKLWDGSGIVEWSGALTGANVERFIENDGTYPKFKKSHNIYGGGYLACTVTDSTRVEVTNGAVPADLIKLDVWKKSFRDDANPHFYVFGGGYGAFTQVANTDVTVGVEGYFSDDEDESTNEQWSLDVSFDEANNTTDDAHTHDGSMGIYGNGYGIGGYTVLGVIGGGYAGLVKDNTNVKLGGTTFVHRVYGGGYGQKAAYDALDGGTDITSEIAGYESRTRENLGEVGGNTRVTISLSEPDAKGRTGGVYGDVFGGGAGVDPSPAGSGDFTDYVDMGKVRGVTRVDIVENARVHGNVYGGGDVASVANVASKDSVTLVKVRGGDVFGSVFAGGKGRIAAKANDYTTLGNVTGNSYVIVRDSVAKETIDEEEIKRTISPNVYGNIYGGGEVGDVTGNSNVVVEGGNIGGNVFGAGYGDIDKDNKSSADIMGSSNVTINGGTFMWNKTAGLDGNVKSLVDADIDRETALAIVEARQKGEASPELAALQTNYADVFDLESNHFKNDHNIYGGGNTVSIVGGYIDLGGAEHKTDGDHSATITVNHGMVTDEESYYDDRTWKLNSILKQLCTGNNSHPQFSVLGGGYGINTKIMGNTDVNVQIGKDSDSNPATVDYPKQAEDLATWSALYSKFATDYAQLSKDDKDEYYGGEGANGLARYETSRLANIFRIPHHTFMNIVGGGMAGYVTGNTTVTLTNQSLCQNVFGGGIGIMPESPTGTENYGQVAGTTTVNILGGIIKGNVYGGGAGMESYKKDDGSFIDFPDMGAVLKNTTVTIDGTPSGTIVFGKVFGGGDIGDVTNSANAEYTTDVTIKGGCVYQQVFAGASGVLRSEAKDYTELGKVTGNTRVTIKDDTNSPWLWNRVYGGGSYGSVTGNTTVEIQGGHLGHNIFGAGLGDVRTLANGTESITTSYVGTEATKTTETISTINVTGGEWCLSQMWDIENRHWMPKKNNTLSAQFDEKNKKFLINHNMYGGGNAASKVWGSTLINMDKSLLKGNTNLGHDDDGRDKTSLFASTEWKEVYNKVGSFHFCLIGGGYGEHTEVTGNTTVDVNIPAANPGDAISAAFIESETDKLKDNMYTLFKSEQAVMDVIGGGYNGKVGGNTLVNISGDPFIRRVFGGSFYADIAGNTNVTITSACVDDIFAGGTMGDVKGTATLNIGADDEDTNSKILICHDVYGGNDVSGQINGRITVNIKGGKIYHNVYGAGNGNYLYALNEERQKVTAVEGYLAQGSVYDLVYEVPRRAELMPASAESSSEAARLVNINSYRPLAQYINLNIAGVESSPCVPGDATARVKVLGKVFGGGNTATVTKLDGTSNPTVTVNIGNYVNANEVFMGADGEAMFDESTSGFLNAFKRINNIVLSNGINWSTDPYNTAIPETYLPLNKDDRQKTFPHIIDLYFQPVQMSVQPELKWNGTKATHDSNPTITGTTIGSFFCGGNRGNMDVKPATGGNVVDYLFPAGLRITNKIVGGCNNANFTRTDLGVVHEGGYLLGSRKTANPMIRLTVKADMTPTLSGDTYTGGNVYGGCYKSGSIHGDVQVDVLSNMIDGLDVDKLAATKAAGTTVASVYGAGYGTDSFVYGDINVTLGDGSVSNTQDTSDGGSSLDVSLDGAGGGKVTDASPVTYEDTGSSVNNLYGGGELGNVIGNTTVKVLNGHVVTDVVGGSYSGNVYGSTHVLVGYPQYYTANKSGIYNLQRADKSDDNLDKTNADGSYAIKREIKLIKGDIISPVVYDAISGYSTTQASDFTVNSENPAPADWNNVNITIGEGVYGGGYALSSGYTGTGGAGTYTVKKYTADYNVNNSMPTTDYLYNKSTESYGGNTTVLVWDKPDDTREHITISSESADGGFYGDGHLSYAEGFRSGELKGYGYAQHKVLSYDDTDPGNTVEVNEAKVMNTIQRLDLLRLTDNCLILNGARDYTINEVSTTPYSIARVGELQMVSSIDETAALPTDPTVARYRNYLGLTNNIHYVGAIKSNALFDDAYHGADGTIENAETSYKKKKTDIISTWYSALAAVNGDLDKITTAQETAWWKRNSATAKNLIGISSGFAFKVQNTRTINAAGTEELFYGPIDGVVEMKLILPISDEGGGYVYADNVHDDPNNFLETTGNFVFPIATEGAAAHYVVDDCLQTNFDDLIADSKNATDSEIHYWFLIGSHYVYNLHITGYTYNSAGTGKEITFHADTSDGLTVLEGATNDIKITEVTWNHYGKKFAEDQSSTLYDDDILNNTADKTYTLKLSVSYSTDPVTGKVKTLYNEDDFYGVITRGANTTIDQMLSYDVEKPKPEFAALKSPKLAIALDDNVDNSARSYYDAHLARPDTVKIVLKSGSGYDKIYDVNLIIKYVKGPSYDNNILVKNCALPGEFIKIDKSSLVIDSDESFAQNGEFLRIGKLNDSGTALAGDYLTYDTSGKTTSALLKDKVYSDPAGQYIMIPAYYFMNGYGVQYVFTCNNMENADFPVPLASTNKLVVHNYHQMLPRGTHPVDLHLAEAVTRAKDEPTTFAQPRIYIKDYEDLQTMQAWVDTVGVNDKYNKVYYDGTEHIVPTAGQYAQFFLQNDITVQQHTPLADKYYKSIANFGGMFHGDGHSITGIDTNLFDNITSTGNVYNLGLESGSIAGAVETGGAVHNSYEYDNRNHRVYNIDGTTTDYTEEEFNNGTVAYNLNQFYLKARKYLIENSITPNELTAAQSSTLAELSAVEYLMNYYANGDYQYARQHSEGDEYLRTDAHPHYTVDVQTDFDHYETFHDKSHPIDAARKVDVSIPNSLWAGLSEAESNNDQMSLDTSLGDKAATDVATATPKYKPLFNAAKNDDDADATITVVKNDYIFFGQDLQATPEAHPATIVTHDVADMTNRVYRASGFYQSKVDKGFHFNASGDDPRIITYVHDPKTTAIDFTGKRDEGKTPSDGLLEEDNRKIYYAPALDLPPAFYAMRMDAGVTQNLLVYTDNQTGVANTIAKVAATTLNYNDDTEEYNIKGHHVVGTGTPIDTYTAAKMHLVDMEDFNAPIQFTATKAWYVRDPSTETDYVNEAGKAWSSVSLPFTVETATLSEGIERHRDNFNNGSIGTQTDITYFYGDAAKVTASPSTTILNHEFWLRGLTAVNTDAGVTKATFVRPNRALDTDDDSSELTSGFAAYKPFIVSFPGSKFYEFNMEGQTITFGATDAVVKVTDEAVVDSATTVSSYKHFGAYLNNSGKTGAYAIKVGDEGDKFVNGEAIYPFRSYITTSDTPLAGNSLDADFNVQSSIYNGDYILIGDDSSQKLEDILDGDIDRDPDGGVTTQSGLHVYGVGQRLVVVSDFATTLPVYTATGALVRVLDVRPGTATYTGFKQGVYVVDRKKIRLR